MRNKFTRSIATGVIDTGWMDPVYDSSSNPTYGTVLSDSKVFDGNTGTYTYVSATVSSPVQQGSVVGYLPVISASEILTVGMKWKGSVSSTNVAWTVTASADDATAAPGSMRLNTSNGTVITEGPSAVNWSDVGDSTDFLGSGAGVLAWWAGGGGIRAFIQSTSTLGSARAYHVQVRITYRS